MCDEDLRFLLGDWHSDSWAGTGLPSPGTARTSKLFRPLSGSDCDKVLYQTEAIQGRELIWLIVSEGWEFIMAVSSRSRN